MTHSFPTRRCSDLMSRIAATVRIVVKQSRRHKEKLAGRVAERRRTATSPTEMRSPAPAIGDDETLDQILARQPTATGGRRIKVCVAVRTRYLEIGRASCRERVCQYV